MHIGKFVFAQITQFLPQRYFNRVVAKYNDRTRGWSMSHWNHLLVLMFGQLMGCGSLRELTDYTDEKIFREDAMSGWAKKELKDEKIKELNADFTEEKTVTKNLPKGADWFDFNTETLYRGGRDVTIPSALDRTAMFVKAGSILPLAPVMQYATEKQWDNLDIVIYPGCNATFLLYEDEGDNYNYERGAYSTIEMKWDNKKRTLTIDSRKGNFPGMMTNRRFNIRLAGTEDVKTVNYNGAAIDVSM